MTQQSIGMATGTGVSFGDGDVGTGYPTSRMNAMETKTFSNGVLLTGNLFAITGPGSSNITISDGAAIVGGFFYENTSAKNINVSTVANGTYNLVILANDTAGAVTVTRAVTGTTVLARTVRLCIATNAQLVGKVYLKIADVEVLSTLFDAAYGDNTRFSSSTSLPYQSYAYMNGGSVSLTSGGSTYTTSGFSSSFVTNDNLFETATSPGELYVYAPGLYSVSAIGSFSTGTTGNRVILIARSGTILLQSRHAAAGVANQRFTLSGLVEITAVGQFLQVQAISSAASQTFDSVNFIVSRA